MSTRQPSPGFDAGEWDAQERGLRSARQAVDDPPDPAARDYRLVARAIATAPRSQPPPDFAAAVAASAGADAGVGTRDPGYERILVRGLLLVLGAAAVVVAALSAGPAWQALRAASTAGTMPWAAAAAACVAAAWALGQAQQLRGLPPATRRRPV